MVACEEGSTVRQVCKGASAHWEKTILLYCHATNRLIYESTLLLETLLGTLEIQCKRTTILGRRLNE